MTIIQNDELTSWLESAYLTVKDVSDNDIVTVVDILGLVESFGKKKFQISVLHNGKAKLLNLNKVQYTQASPIRAGERLSLNLKSFNGGTTLDLRKL